VSYEFIQTASWRSQRATTPNVCLSGVVCPTTLQPPYWMEANDVKWWRGNTRLPDVGPRDWGKGDLSYVDIKLHQYVGHRTSLYYKAYGKRPTSILRAFPPAGRILFLTSCHVSIKSSLRHHKPVLTYRQNKTASVTRQQKRHKITQNPDIQFCRNKTGTPVLSADKTGANPVKLRKVVTQPHQ